LRTECVVRVSCQTIRPVLEQPVPGRTPGETPSLPRIPKAAGQDGDVLAYPARSRQCHAAAQARAGRPKCCPASRANGTRAGLFHHEAVAIAAADAPRARSCEFAPVPTAQMAPTRMPWER